MQQPCSLKDTSASLQFTEQFCSILSSSHTIGIFCNCSSADTAPIMQYTPSICPQLLMSVAMWSSQKPSSLSASTIGSAFSGEQVKLRSFFCNSSVVHSLDSNCCVTLTVYSMHSSIVSTPHLFHRLYSSPPLTKSNAVVLNSVRQQPTSFRRF